MKDGDNFIHNFDNLLLLLQLNEMLKPTKRLVDFDKPDNEYVLKKFHHEFYTKHCKEKENVENEL